MVGVDTTACIVLTVSPCDVRRVACVVTRRSLSVLEDVHEPFGHASVEASVLPCEITARSTGQSRLHPAPANCGCQRTANGPPSLALKSQRATVDILRLSGVKARWLPSEARSASVPERRMARQPKLGASGGGPPSRESRAKVGTGTGFCERL
jgi:hypothetical protein